MANLTLNSIQGGMFSWTISNMSASFNTSNYREAGITSVRFNDGATSISGVVSRVYASSSGNSFSIGPINVSYTPGTYTFYGYAQAANGFYYIVSTSGSSITVNKNRPNNWYWSNSFASGQDVNITASEWNAFTQRVREFDEYMGTGPIGNYTQVSRGQDIMSSHVGLALSRITVMKGYQFVAIQPQSGDILYPSFFYALQNALNSLP